MKLLVFSPGYPPRIGGLETHAAEFNHHLINHKAITHITVFTPRLPSTSIARETPEEGLTVIRFPAIDIVPNYPLPKFWTGEFWRLWTEIRKSKPDIVISRTRFFLTSFMAMVYAKTKGTKWIHIEHGSEFVQLSSPLSSFIARVYDETLGRLTFRLSTKNVAISQAVDRFIHRFTKRESALIYRGIELAHIKTIAEDSRLKKDHPGKLIVMVVGRLYKWKGIAHSIRAIHSLPPEVKDKLVFVVVGDGEDYASLKELAGDAVVMLGAQPRDTAIALLKSADIYIHSSLPGGGLSTSLLEAMACGCAVVASPHEGANEVVTSSNGILIEEPTAAQIAEAVTTYVRDPQLIQTMGREAKKTIEARFSWDASVEAYVSLFKTLNS